MNLKYYLKGLGLGIIVTALILGIHYKLNTNTMSDAEVKKRAAELGMVENSTLAQINEQSAEELLESINQPEEETESDKNDVAPTQDFDDKISDLEKEVDELEEQATEVVSNAEDDPDKKPETEETQEAEAVEEDPEEQQDLESENEEPVESVSEGETIIFTIVSGDSSYSVAKKLVSAGLVLDASEYDSYLCNYGYDRYIRTGNFQIPMGASNEQIAKIITGK